MKKQIVKNNFSDLIPKREEYLNSQQLVRECAKINISISRKTIHNYIKDGLLPRPLHIAKEALFHKEFIMQEIKGIYILKSIFHVDYNGLKELAVNKYVNFQKIASDVCGLVEYYEANNSGKVGERPLLVNLANEKFLQKVASIVLKEVRNGTDIRGIDLRDFIEKAWEKEKK